SKPSPWRKYLTYLIVLGLLAGAGYYGYTHYWLTKGKLPWPVFKTTPEVPPPVVQPPAPPVVVQPAAPRPRVVKPPPRPRYAIQVASCFFDACVASYRDLLAQAGYKDLRLRSRASQTQTLELYSLTTLGNRQAAQEWAERVNNDNHQEGHAYVLEEHGVFRISLGEFSDLERANTVMDALNQRYRGQMVLAHRVKAMPYDLKIILAGGYPTRPEADQALAKLQAQDRNLAGAFVVPY
ncbi:MAG TPA: SPOR domain-containing protein, partial [bacterium]|nr:SPOR domain-containing protein [bacterium]